MLVAKFFILMKDYNSLPLWIFYQLLGDINVIIFTYSCFGYFYKSSSVRFGTFLKYCDNHDPGIKRCSSLSDYLLDKLRVFVFIFFAFPTLNIFSTENCLLPCVWIIAHRAEICSQHSYVVGDAYIYFLNIDSILSDGL